MVSKVLILVENNLKINIKHEIAIIFNLGD